MCVHVFQIFQNTAVMKVSKTKPYFPGARTMLLTPCGERSGSPCRVSAGGAGGSCTPKDMLGGEARGLCVADKTRAQGWEGWESRWRPVFTASQARLWAVAPHQGLLGLAPFHDFPEKGSTNSGRGLRLAAGLLKPGQATSVIPILMTCPRFTFNLQVM